MVNNSNYNYVTIINSLLRFIRMMGMVIFVLIAGAILLGKSPILAPANAGPPHYVVRASCDTGNFAQAFPKAWKCRPFKQTAL